MRMIGVLAPYLDGSYYGGLLYQLNRKLVDRGYRVIALKTPRSSSNEYPIPLAARHTSGWIVLDAVLNPGVLDELKRLDQPIVGINHSSEHYPCVHMDIHGGMEQLTEHLIGHGHRRIAFVGNMDNKFTRSRYEGYAAAFKRNGMELDPSLLFKIGNDPQAGGYLVAEQIIQGKLNATALATNSDQCAIAAMESLIKAGYRIPEDIAVVGYDNSPMTEYSTPALSSISPPLEEAALQSAGLLIDMIQSGERQRNDVWLKTYLVPRRSCGCVQSAIAGCTEVDRKELFHALQQLKGNVAVNRYISAYAEQDDEAINNLSWMHKLHSTWGCYGQWTDTSERKQIQIKRYYVASQIMDHSQEMICSASEFPPIQLIPDGAFADQDHVLCIYPIAPESRDWGVLAMVQPLNQTMAFFQSDTISYSLNRLATAWEKRELLESVRKANQLLITVSKTVTDAVFVWNMERDMIEWSDRAQELFRKPPENVQEWLGILHPEDRMQLSRALKEHAHSEEAWCVEYRIVQGNQEDNWMECNGMRMYDADIKANLMIGSLRDITERKQSEELLRKSEKLSVIGQLAAGVAHEIRNPLTSLKGFTRLMKEKYTADFPYIDIMESELDRINLIVNEFMSLAKPHLTQFNYIPIEHIMRSVVSILEPQAALMNVNIHMELDDSLPALFCDENQLKQLFINILKNAIESMPAGGKVHILVTRANPDMMCIRIRDEGSGIPEGMIQRVGEPFFTTKEKGTGLGLMVSQRIVDAHGGVLKITSERDQGTTVSMLLPFRSR